MSKKPQDVLLLRMIVVMIAYNSLVQVLLLCLPNVTLIDSTGLWLGALVGISMAIHIKRSAEDTLDIGGLAGEKYAKKKAAIRMATVIIVFSIIFYYEIGSVITTFIGVMGLKVSVYFQPIIERYMDSK